MDQAMDQAIDQAMDQAMGFKIKVDQGDSSTWEKNNFDEWVIDSPLPGSNW